MSDGYCEVDFQDTSDDADPVEFHDSRLVTAKKAHVCSECSGPIEVGERYRRTAYKFEGVFGEDKRCPSCDETAGEFNYFIMGGSLWAMLEEEWDNGANVQGCINRLTTARAKEHMRQQWQKWHEKQALRARARMAQRRDARSASADSVDGRDRG